MMIVFQHLFVIIDEQEIKARDEILIYQHQFDY